MCDILNPYAKETGGGRNDTGTLDRRTGIQKRTRAAGGETSLHAAPEKSDCAGVGAAGGGAVRHRRHVLLADVRQVLTGGGYADSRH